MSHLILYDHVCEELHERKETYGTKLVHPNQVSSFIGKYFRTSVRKMTKYSSIQVLIKYEASELRIVRQMYR